jgi:hypothetical protein
VSTSVVRSSPARLSPSQPTGLLGLVDINRFQHGAGAWESGATVSAGSTTLTAYNYPETPAAIGGGSAGLVSYRLHNSACNPVNAGHVIATGGSHPSVRLRHYGPLSWNSGSGVPANISRRLACSSDAFASVSASTSNFALDDDNPSAAEPNRTLVVTLPFQFGYEYKITPTSNLKSYVTGSGDPAVTWDSDYTFTVVSECYADVNGSGVVDADDLIAVILDWGSCPSPPAACPVDIVPLPCGNDAADVDDLIAVILNWGMNCATGEYDDVGSMDSVEDCMDKASESFTPYSPEWLEMVQRCVQALCEAQIIDCD